MSDYRIEASKHRTVKITGVTDETPTVKSFIFHDEFCANAQPGQFAMIWIPRVDEVPMSLSALNPNAQLAAITVEKIGEATSALHEMPVGATIGVRGPFGNGYSTTEARNALIVGGGTGMASLAPLAERLVEQKARVRLLIGAMRHHDLLFSERMNQLLSSVEGCSVLATTEDGSYGQKGLVTEPARKMLSEGEKFDMLYTCGPERMMYEMLLMAEKHDIPFQASLERLMRCSIGLCGTCVVGKYRVCQDGPVFSGRQLHEVRDEFGHFSRGFDGRKILTT